MLDLEVDPAHQLSHQGVAVAEVSAVPNLINVIISAGSGRVVHRQKWGNTTYSQPAPETAGFCACVSCGATHYI